MLSEIDERIERGDLDGARLALLDMIEERPHCGAYHELLGWIEYRRGEIERSRRALEEATILAPIGVRSRILIAVSYALAGRDELACDLLSDVVDAPHASLDCGMLLLAASGFDAADRPDLALRCCRRAAQRDPSEGESYFLASRYGSRCGLPTNVVTSLARRAVSLDSTQAGYRIVLAGLLAEAGDREEAAAVVANLTHADFSAICCVDCGEMLAELFESRGDWRRVVMCRERLLLLETQNRHGDSDHA